MGKHAPASPYLQEMVALLVSKMPPEQAVLVAERLGLKPLPMAPYGSGMPSGTASPRRANACLYHGDEHLWAVAHELFGQGTPEAREWVTPLLQRLRQDEIPALIHHRQELQPTLTQALQKKRQTQIDYFADHQNRMHYRDIIRARQAVAKGTATPTQRLKANEPPGSVLVHCRR